MDFENRKKELESCFDGLDEGTKKIINPLIDNVVFIEEKLEQLKKLPFISTNPKNSLQQRQTPASKMFKELLQQYNNCIKILNSILIKNDEDEISPLRNFANNVMDIFENGD